VALNDSDQQSCQGGQELSPFASIQKAIECVTPGDTVFIRGGRYFMPTTPNFAGYVYIDKSGTASAPITFMSHPGEWAILDYSNFQGGNDTERVYLDGADWIVIRDLEIYNSPQQGIVITNNANHNRIVNVVLNESWGGGLLIYQGSHNQVYCSDAIDNGKNNTIDPGNSDGFGSTGHGGRSVNNRFYFNVAVHNTDDGFDSWVGQGSVYIGNVSINNGYNGGNGSGFKLGPGPVPDNIFGIGTGWSTDPPQADWFQSKAIVRRNISYGNIVGFDSNSGAGITVDNNTAWKNQRNYVFYKNQSNPNNAINTLNNNISYQGSPLTLQFTQQTTNNWNLSIPNPGFNSLLPSNPSFLSLSSTSPVMDRGTVLPWINAYKGTAPDLGALELGRTIASLRSQCPTRP
jgi:hypothetical protein